MKRPISILLFIFILLSISSAADLYQQGINLLKAEKYDEATTVFEQYLASDSTNAKAYYNLGLAYVNLAKYDNAVAAWQKAIALNPEFEAAHYNLGLVYIMPQAYHTQEAIQEFQIVIKLNPNNYKAHYQLAVGYHRIAKHPEAIQELDTVLNLKPDLIIAEEFKIQIYRTMQDFPSAIRIAERLYRKEKTDQNKSILFDLYAAYGIQLRNQNKYDESLSQLYQAQNLVSGHPQIQYELANTYAAMGRVNEAESLFNYVLSRDPKNPNLLNNIANFYVDNNYNLDRATLLIDSALRLFPSELDSPPYAFLVTKGWIEYKQRNYPEAYNHFQMALKILIAPYQPEPGLNEKDLQAFLAVQPDYGAFPEVMLVRYQLALAAWYFDKKDECRKLLGQILAVNTEDPAALEWQQKAKEWLGNK